MDAPTVKAVLDFAHSAPTDERVLEFARQCGDAEEAPLWRKEWYFLSAVEQALSVLQTRGLGIGFVRREVEPFEDILHLPPVPTENGEERLLREVEGESLEEKAARFIAARLTVHPPRLRYVNEGGRAVELREKTSFCRAWEILDGVLSGAIEARQCVRCGAWEQKGEGYTRDTWLQHRKCGAAVYSKQYRGRRRKKEEAEDREFFEE